MTAATAVQGHLAGDTFSEGGRWCTPCECGKRFTSDTEAKARARWRSHSNQASPAPATPVPARAKECGCGCTAKLENKANGLFRSGHDARFKAVLTRSHAAGEKVRHPLTGEQSDPLAVADWLDERRGSGSFWRDRVLAGHKPAPERQPRVPRGASTDTKAASVARVDRLIAGMEARRPAPGDVGIVTLKSGQKIGAQVLARTGDDSLSVRLLEGPGRNTDIVIRDEKFTKAKK